MPAVRFHFDYLSPYAYLGFHRIRALAADRRLTLELRPTLLAGLLSHWGQLGPAEIPPKRVFTFKDALRRAADDGLPLTGPATHPFNPLTALRVSLPEVAGAEQLRIVEVLYDASWGRGAEIGTDEGVALALDQAGLDGAGLVALTKDPTVKEALKRATADAVHAGVFGVPTFVVDDELFFGHDRVSDLSRFLDGDDPIDARTISDLVARTPSAVRRPR